MNKISEKYIEEQKKIIKVQKSKTTTSQNKKENTFPIESLNKKTDTSKFDKLEISLLTKNIMNLNEQIKTMSHDVNFKNLFLDN